MIHGTPAGVEIDVRVIPRASKTTLAGERDGRLLVRLGLEAQTGRLQLALMFAHIFKAGHGLAGLVPAGVEGEDVFFEHALEQSNGDGAIAQDQPLLAVAADACEAELLIESARGRQVLHSEADGKSTKSRGLFDHGAVKVHFLAPRISKNRRAPDREIRARPRAAARLRSASPSGHLPRRPTLRAGLSCRQLRK